MSEKYIILVDGLEWEYKHKTINGYLFEDSEGNTRVFVRWRVIEGQKEFQQKQSEN